MRTPLEKQLRLAREQVTQLVAALTSSNMLVENFIDANRHLTEQNDSLLFQARYALSMLMRKIDTLESENRGLEPVVLLRGKDFPEQISSETQRWQYRFIKPIKDSNDSKLENTNTQPNLSPTTK